MAFYECRIYDASGVLKRIVSPATCSRRSFLEATEDATFVRFKMDPKEKKLLALVTILPTFDTATRDKAYAVRSLSKSGAG